MSSPKAKSAGGDWTTPKRVIKPSMDPLHPQGGSLSPTNGTFGSQSRFNSKLAGYGACSPHGKDYFRRSALFKNEYLEQVRTASLGIGERPSPTRGQTQVPEKVGPGSYTIVHSVVQHRSPLDGKDFCTMSMHAQLPSALTPSKSLGPGPHHRYEVNKPIPDRHPRYHLEAMSRGGRHSFKEDMDQPGPGEYPVTHHLSIAHSASCPDMKGATVPKVRTVKTTFGLSGRPS